MMSPLNFLCSIWKAESIGKATLICDGCIQGRGRERNCCEPLSCEEKERGRWKGPLSTGHAAGAQVCLSWASAPSLWPRQSLTHSVPPTSLGLRPRVVGGGSEQNHLYTKILGKWKHWEKWKKGIGISKSETFTIEKLECLKLGNRGRKRNTQTELEYTQLNYSF